MSIIRIYNRALLPEEVAANYAGEFAPELAMDPAEDAFGLPSDPGPHTQTISLPDDMVAESDIAVTLSYNARHRCLRRHGYHHPDRIG
jgi:hypothetical protein